MQTARYDFVYDDSVQIVQNPRIRSFSNLGAVFTEHVWNFLAPGTFGNYYRPLQIVTYMVAFAAGDLSSVPYHSANIALHVFASLAVFWLGWEIFRNAFAFWGALLFAVHPMHTESVAWIAGITDVGCGLFYFLSLASYLRYRKTTERKMIWQALSLGSFLIALLYKEMALTLPATIFLLDFVYDDPRNHSHWRARLNRWTPYFLLLLAYLILRINALGGLSRTAIPLAISAADRVLTMLYFVGRYLQDLMAPVKHNAYHVFRPFSQLDLSEWAGPLLTLVAWTGLVWVLRNDRRLCFLAVLVPITLIPVLNLGGVGQNMYTERYLYIPSLGFCLLLPALISRYFSKLSILMPVGIAVVALLGYLTTQRNSVWKDDMSFYIATISASPDAALIRNNLGMLLFGKKDFVSARREFQAALNADSKLLVRSPRDRAASLLGLSAVANAEGRLEQAWKYAEEASNTNSISHRSDAYQILGMLMGKRKNYAEAEKLLRHALELQPTNATAHVNLGNIFLTRQNVEAAEKEFRLAIELEPRSAGPRVSLGLLLFRTNRAPEAMTLLKQAIALDPANIQARELLQQIASVRETAR